MNRAAGGKQCGRGLGGRDKGWEFLVVIPPSNKTKQKPQLIFLCLDYLVREQFLISVYLASFPLSWPLLHQEVSVLHASVGRIVTVTRDYTTVTQGSKVQKRAWPLGLSLQFCEVGPSAWCGRAGFPQLTVARVGGVDELIYL